MLGYIWGYSSPISGYKMGAEGPISTLSIKWLDFSGPGREVVVIGGFVAGN